MPASSSSHSSVLEARRRIGAQLREIRQDAGLTGPELARRAGWHGHTKVSKIENAVRPISADDLRTWCRVSDAPPARTEALIAELRAAEGMWITYQRLNRGGLRGAQESVRERYARVMHMRVYCSKLIPGLLQTEAYTRVALETVRVEQGVQVGDPETDVAEAVAERMDRQRCLHRPGTRFAFLLEEDVLWHRTTPLDVHAGQLRHLLMAMRWPSVSLGVIPRARDRGGVWPEETFIISDSSLVTVELVSGYLSVSTPPEVAMYLAAWERLAALAVHGDPARELINEAIEALGPQRGTSGHNHGPGL